MKVTFNVQSTSNMGYSSHMSYTLSWFKVRYTLPGIYDSFTCKVTALNAADARAVAAERLAADGMSDAVIRSVSPSAAPR